MTPAEARSRVREAGGAELLDRLEHLDTSRATRPRDDDPPPAPHADDTALDYDVVLAGGGLSLLYAPLLAARGLRVGVFERGRAAVAQREWNASGPELQALVRAGLVTDDELDQIVVARYARGICRWHGGGTYPVTGVLDHAVDAGALLQLARRRAQEAGVDIHEGHALVGHACGMHAIASRFRTAGRSVDIRSRLLLDGRGASSPYARVDLLCPTIGGVTEGLAEGQGDDEVDPAVGEMLVTVEGVEDGRQHIWEAFPGRPGQTTIYLFHFALANRVPAGELTRLFARFFDRLHTYKRGDARLVRPTFGYITGWSRLVPPPSPPGPRVVLLGDAAARHSPLSFCGFGGTLRSLGPATSRIASAFDERREQELTDVVDDRALHAATGLLARMMVEPQGDPHALNRLFDAAFGALHAMGNETYAQLLRDEMGPADFVRFLARTGVRMPRLLYDVPARLGTGALTRWARVVATAYGASAR